MKRRYSRRARIETRRNYKKIIFYLLISLAVIFILFFFGLNLLIKYAGILMNLDSSDTPVEIQDTTPPPPPRLRAFPRITNEPELEISGNTEAGAKVRLFLNNREEEVVANNQGEFTYIFELNDGRNQFYSIAVDSSGNESTESEKIEIEFDDEPPELVVNKPEDGQEFFGDNNRQISIEGQTETSARVRINGRWAVVDTQGKFSTQFNLEEGENRFEVIATDEAENETSHELVVNFSP